MTNLIIKILFFIFIALLFVNNANALESYPQIHMFPGDTVYDCYVTDVFSEGGENYIKIKPVQFLWDKDALTEALKDGAADYTIDTVTNDSNWFVPNDYYINVGSSTAILKFRIAEIVKVSICDPVEPKRISIKELMINPSYYKNTFTHGKIEETDYSPYLITIEKEKVTIIQETYVP